MTKPDTQKIKRDILAFPLEECRTLLNTMYDLCTAYDEAQNRIADLENIVDEFLKKAMDHRVHCMFCNGVCHEDNCVVITARKALVGK